MKIIINTGPQFTIALETDDGRAVSIQEIVGAIKAAEKLVTGAPVFPSRRLAETTPAEKQDNDEKKNL